MPKFPKFLSDDAGAVTVEWVALTASVLLLGLVAVYSVFNNGAAKAALGIDSSLNSMNVVIPDSTFIPG